MRNYDLEGPGWKRGHGIDGKQHGCTGMSGVQRYFDAQFNIHKLVDASYSKSVPLCHRWCHRKIMVRFFFFVITFESYGLFWCLDLLELFLSFVSSSFWSFTSYWLLWDVTKSLTIQTFSGSETIFFSKWQCVSVCLNEWFFLSESAAV